MTPTTIILSVVILLLVYVLYAYLTGTVTKISQNANLNAAIPPINKIDGATNTRYGYTIWVYVNNVDTDGSKTPDVLKVYYTNKGDKTNQSYTVNIKPQKWNQIVFNYTSSQVDLFINGHLEKTFVFDGNEPEYLASDVISVGSTDGLDGAICNIKYHYVPQSKGQIATSYNLLMKQNPPTNIL